MRALARGTVGCAAGIGLVIALLLALPTVTGHRSLTVLSGSMEPTLETGSIVVDQVVSPTEARIGDIVTFSDPNNPGRTITHRLVKAKIVGDTAHMVTRGDANDASESWTIPADGEIGRVALHVPKLGYVRALIGSRNGYLVLMGLVMLLGTWVLVDFWRRPSRPAAALAGAGG